MAFFDTLKERATDLAQTGVAKSKQLAETAKLKADNLAQEDAIKKAYIEIGKLYYAERGAAPEAAYAEACEKITAAKAAIEANNEKADALKAKEGTVEEVAEEVVEEVAEAAEEVAETVEEIVEE